ncbi:hypothetical protein DPEC_G00250710 [Dallia pectoralis]|uniref:Uncharacterized protein n=1 Tax=Dallia pectoralis TaxID=75939 RepID=A0ACC2FT82_DALPE|nr:hypothetical protein DPEC_G00250710 [Dallia pectoralis]
MGYFLPKRTVWYSATVAGPCLKLPPSMGGVGRWGHSQHVVIGSGEFHRTADTLATNESSTNISSLHSTPSDSLSVNLSSANPSSADLSSNKLSSINSSSVLELHYFNATVVISSSDSKAALRSSIDKLKPAVPNHGMEREMTCRSWGQYNYETFDGLYYHFPGKCSYTLLRDCENNGQVNIIVQVHNDPECNSSPYSCTRSVGLFLPGEGEVRLHRNKVTFKGESVQLPHHIHDVELERISGYVLVTQQHGFTLAWDGRSGSVYIKLSPEWVGRTCGLCGNFNADLQDDLKTSYGVVTEDLSMFGNSWVEQEPQRPGCPMVLSMYPSPCTSRDPHTVLKVEEVCSMLLEEPFTACHEFVSPLSYMASCSNDLCLSGPSGNEVCQVLTEYARSCAHADHPLLDWRTRIPQCAVACPAELQYKECITCCPATCNEDRMCIDSKLPCLDGCYCPDELIYEEGRCVKASDCPCEYHGMIYPSGQSVQEECNNCTCNGGVWNCTEYSCPGECSVTGDMYFHSFDGRMFTFPASCQYVLAKSHNSGKFTVTIQNAPCGPNLDGACIQSVSLVVDEDPRTEITISHLGEVFMAGQYRISLPYSDEVFHIQELSSMFLQVHTSPGLRLQYSWREFRLYLQVDELWKDNTVGLCGTFNGNIQDDFLSPAGMIESTPHLFGNAWKVSSACVPSLTVPQMDPCDTHQQAASYATEMCDVLNQELFSACHEYLSPVPFHQQCLSDTCKCGQPCLCSSLAHYARHCRRYSVIIEFRASVLDCAVTCPETMEYGTCVSSCQRRCSALSTQQPCGEECEEGCVCPLGTFYSTRTHTCVSRHECPCSFLGANYAPGDVIMTSAGVQLCHGGKLVSLSSDIDKQCPLGQMYIDCVDGVSPGGGLGCEHTCESHLLNLTCSAHEPCVPGCVCPHGLLKHGDECFEPDACPCLWKGKEYYPGDKVTSPCHHCVCQHGTFQCVFRPCPSMCTAYGDRHYRTFDGLLFDYVGVCKVYLVKSSDLMMSVMAENVDCYESGVICRKSLVINIGRTFIAFDDDSGEPNPSSVIDGKQEVFVWSAGFFTVVHVPEEDLTVLWDHKTTVHIQAGPRWQGKLSGLCGNFDLRTVNEMRTPENIDSATPQEFGNSWTAAECVNSPDIRHPCSLSPLREPFAKRQCGVLLSEVFQGCHPVVDVTWFYMNCLADTCGCNRGGDCECFCTSVAAYAHRCCHQGVTVDWRSPSICPYDCEYYNKVLGKGPYRLVTYREKSTILACNRSSGTVFPKKGDPTTAGILSFFMMTPGLSRTRPHDTSLVSFEASDRPNYFLVTNRTGHITLSKWVGSDAFWDAATFVLHRDTWIQGYVSLEAFGRPRFFLHFTSSWIHLMKYKHTDGFRKGTLFKLTGSASDGPAGSRCQWRYESCVSPCYRTCSDPSRTACVTIPKVEGCQPLCPDHMVLDEVTQRCVHTEDCIKPPVAVRPITTVSSAESTPTAVAPSATAVATTASSRPASPDLATARSTSTHAPPGVLLTAGPTDVGHTPATSAPPYLTISTTSAELDVRSTTTVVAPPVTFPGIPTPSHEPAVGPEGVPVVPAVETSTTVDHIGRTTVVRPSTEPTDQVPFPITTSTTRPPPSTSVGPWTSSPLGLTQTSTLPTLSVFPTETTIKVTTRPGDTEAPLFTTSSLHWTTVTEPYSGTAWTTAKTTDYRTTTPITTLPLPTESRTKPAVIEITTVPLPPGVTTTDATAVPSRSQTTMLHIANVTKPREPTSTHITESTSPVIPFTTLKTTPSIRPETTHPLSSVVSTEEMVHTSPAELRTPTMQVPELPTTMVVDELPTLTTTSTTAAQPTLEQTEQTKETTLSVPLATTSIFVATVVPPTVKVTDMVTTTTHPATTSLAYTEKTSWPAGAATTERTVTEAVDRGLTTTATAGPSTVATTTTQPIPPETSGTTSIGSTPALVPVTTLLTIVSTSPSLLTTSPDSPVSLTETTTVPQPATFQAPTTLKTTEPWTPPHSEASATSSIFTSSTKRVTTPEIPVKPDVSTKLESSPHQVISAAPTVDILHPVTTSIQPAITTATAKTSSMGDTSTVVVVTSWTERPDRPVTGTLTTMVSTATVPPLPGVHTTTIRPVTIQSLTETTRTPPDTASPGPVTATAVSVVPTTSAQITLKLVTTARTTEYPTGVSTTSAPPDITTTAASSVPIPSLTMITTSTMVPAGMTTVGVPSTSSSRVTLTPEEPTTSLVISAEVEATPGVKPKITTEFTPAVPATSLVHTLPPTATPETTTSSLLVSPHTRPDEVTTTMAISSTRMCTPPYSEMVDECTKNICVSGQLVMFNKSQNCPYNSTPPNCGLLGFAVLVNGDKCCPQWDCPCRCSVFPDLNVITFDGNSVAVFKAALYIVSQLPNETVSVTVQECPAASDSVLWNFTNLCLVALNITHKTNHVIVNRLQRRLYVNSRYAKPRFKKFGFEVLDTGNMYLIRTPAGLSLQWFHSTGMMVIETESYTNKLPTMGLCGCCDGNPANDLMLSNGTTIGESEDPAVFIDSWQVPNTTSYISQSRRREVNCTTSDCSRCVGMLQNNSFSLCHAFVPVSTFCEVWVRDVEYVNNPCVALAAYAASCHKFNVCIEWRSPDYCPFICPDELRYQACLPGCTAQSCSNHDFDYNHVQCSSLTEGCVCPEGTLLHRPYSAVCVPHEKCACTDSSGVARAHGEVWKASRDGCCMYRCDNDSVVPVEYNCSAAPQPLCRRAGEVVVGLADDSSCCPRRVCVCNQTLCEVFPPDCQYGEKLVSYFREDSCCPDYACECDPEHCELDIPACREDQTLIATRADGSCCLGHMCMCSACSDVVPKCQDGEVLTVDFNSTDLCCPVYHCVCEPYRCAEITCPVGMSTVSLSTPDRCCPLYNCECACDKMSSPKCSLGETLQEDRTFLADPVNQCACKRFKCVREAVCVYGERGVMRPGQTLVEHGENGVCLTTQCTRSLDQTTGFHRLRTATNNCSAHCQPNQIYLPPKDQTTCCGVCKNISCLYHNNNGTAILYKPGKSWVSNCMKYECTDTLSGPTLVAYSSSCPPFNETDCMKIGGTVVSYMDGCCKTCKEDGKACQKVTVRMTIRKNDCRSNRPVNIVSCDGKCPSASIYNYNINTYARFCKCCREMGLQRRSVQLYCSGNSTWVSYSIQEPTDCSCQWS